METGRERLKKARAISTEEVCCGLCGAKSSEYYATSQDFEYQTCSNEWTFVRCLECENIYLNPRPARSELGVIYPEDYYAYHYDTEVNVLARRVKEYLDKMTFSAITGLLSVPFERFLDIGCGNGRYLKLVRTFGLTDDNIYGIELHDAVVQNLKEEGFQVQNRLFEEAQGLPENAFQLITLFSVLEHVSSPRELLLKAHTLLSNGGLVVFEVPNINGINARIFRERYWGGYHTPRHWNLFSPDIIKRASEKLGYRCVDIRYTPGHAFWPWSFHHALRFALGFDTVGSWFSPSRCLPVVGMATILDKFRALFGQQTDNMIVMLEKRS